MTPVVNEKKLPDINVEITEDKSGPSVVCTPDVLIKKRVRTNSNSILNRFKQSRK